MFPFLLRNINTALQIILFLDIIIDLFARDRFNPALLWIRKISDVLLIPARRLFATLGLGRSGIDWTPLFTIIALNFLEALILRLYYG